VILNSDMVSRISNSARQVTVIEANVYGLSRKVMYIYFIVFSFRFFCYQPEMMKIFDVEGYL
jgi:hypothetical protein